MEAFDPRAFRRDRPQFCEPASIHVPGLIEPPSTEGARPFNGDLSSFAAVEKEIGTLPAMLKMGAEAIAFYRSFRFGDDWGVYIRPGAVVALRHEFDRILMRDLKGYMAKTAGYEGTPVEELVEKIEYSLVLDFLTAHMRLHHAVDVAAAQLEASTSEPRYAPYQAKQFEEIANPPKDPRVIGNLEECLANFEAFRNYMNPNYTDAMASLVDGALDERDVSEWKAFFIGGRWGVEIANMLSRQPPGYRDVTKLCMRRTSVGSTNYVRVMYMPDPEKRDAKVKELSERIAGGPVESSVLPEELPDFPMWIL